MNYQEAREYMEQRPRYGGALGLDAIRALLLEVQNPQQELSFIHIAGTNGKGSVLSHISTVLTGAGYRIGRYISPTLYSYLERIQVNGVKIGEADYVRLVEILRSAVERMEEKGLPLPSPFEMETVLGFLYFKEQACDYVVLECGLGGKDDATNVVPMEKKKLAVLTSISLDHTEYLGDTLEKITLQKAGIIGDGTCVVSACQKPEAARTLKAYCEAHHCVYRTADIREVTLLESRLDGQRFRYKGQEFSISLAGEAQIENAITAYEALQMLAGQGLKLDTDQIVSGMKRTRWNGRFTKISEKPLFFVDGAHNPDAAAKLRASIEQLLLGKRLIYINGMFADKEYEEVVRITAPLAEQIYTIATPDNDRALPAERLADVIRRYQPRVTPCETISDAVRLAIRAAGEDGVILAFGSLSFIGELTKIVTEGKE